VGNPVRDAEYAITDIFLPTPPNPAGSVDEDHCKTSWKPVQAILNLTTDTSGANWPKPSGSNNGITMYPLIPPPMGRSGVVRINQSTFTIGSTESTLTQSPLNSPTVFNFFFPDFKFPGSLANNLVDSPEFQLTTDTNVSNLTNSLTNMFVSASGGNGNATGLSSFNNGGGSVVMDIGNTDVALGPVYMTADKTSDAGIPALVDELATLLVGGPLETATKNTIVKFVTSQRITAIGTGNPCTITSPDHRLALDLYGQPILGATVPVTISGVTGGTFRNSANTANLPINSTYTATVTGADTFTVPVNCTSISGLALTNAGIPVNFPLNSPTPTSAQMRDRVRAIVHLIITSAEYAVQK
jgi:hypothetical protein